MKIISLNAWFGKFGDNLKRFVEQQVNEVDIFHFQEFSDKMGSDLQPLFSEFQLLTAHKWVDKETDFYLATYVRKGISVLDKETLFSSDMKVGLEMHYRISRQGKEMLLGNVHGTPRPGDKLDNPEIIRQSEGILEKFVDYSGPRVITGDFNLEPDTKSIIMFEKAGFNNLIKEYKIETTRNHWAWDMYPDNIQLFADYAFVSPEVKVKDFRVLPDEVSDHQPMWLEVED